MSPQTPVATSADEPARWIAGELLELPVMPIHLYPHDARSHPDGCDSADRRHDVVEPLAEKVCLEDAVEVFIGAARNKLQVMVLDLPSGPAWDAFCDLAAALRGLEKKLLEVRS